MRFGIRLGTVFGSLTKQGMARTRCRKKGGPSSDTEQSKGWFKSGAEPVPKMVDCVT